MADELSLVRRIRRLGRDRPDRTKITDVGGIDDAAVAIKVPAGHLTKFPQSGVLIEFEDGNHEVSYVTGRDDVTGMLLVDRAADGTDAVPHKEGTTILIKPRWYSFDIMEAVSTVIDLELWPHVWIPGECQIDYQSANSYFALPQGDIDEVAYVYQLSGGAQYQLGFRHVSSTLADDTNFPNGFLLLPGAVDASGIYVAFRTRPTLAGLTPSLEQLTVLGAMAHLQVGEESAGTAPDTSIVDRTLQPGARLRAGVVGWQRFSEARAQHMIALQQAETARRARLVRAS